MKRCLSSGLRSRFSVPDADALYVKGEPAILLRLPLSAILNASIVCIPDQLKRAANKIVPDLLSPIVVTFPKLPPSAPAVFVRLVTIFDTVKGDPGAGFRFPLLSTV